MAGEKGPAGSRLMTPSHRKPVNFILMLMSGFSLLSLGGFLDKLRFSGDDEDYGRQLNCTWRLVTHDGSPVIASCGVELTPDYSLNELELTRNKCDYFVMFGGNVPARVVSEAPLSFPLTRRLRQHSVPIVSIDNSAFLLAACGMVKKRILVHWRHYREFQESFPSVIPLTDRNVLQDNGIISCPGGNATIELAAFLLEKHFGNERAIKGLSDMLVPGFAPPSAASGSGPEYHRMPAAVQRSFTVMRQHINSHLDAKEIARLSGLSRRQLDRCMVATTGLTVRQAYINMKLAHACWLLVRTSRNIAQIATDSGFSDAAHLSRLFVQKNGTTPTKWRHANALNQPLSQNNL